MPFGPEIMLKALGFDPEKILAELGATFSNIGENVKRVAQKLDQLADDQKAINERLERLEKHLGVHTETGDNAANVRRIAGQ